MDSAASESKYVAVVAVDTEIQVSQSMWDHVAASRQFQHLIKIKRAFIIPAFLFFLVYCLSLPVLAGYAPHLMAKKLFWGMSLAYLFALSQFFVGWLIVWRYVKAAARFDELAKDISRQAQQYSGK